MAELATVRNTRRRGIGDMLRSEKVREAAAKLGIAGICLFLCLGAVFRLVTVLDRAPPQGLDALSATQIFTIVCQTIFYLLVLWFTLIRRTAVRRASGWKPRVVAAVGAFSIFGFGLLPPAQGLGLGWHIAAASLLLASAALAMLVLPYLGRSFSLMSEARGLVTRGPYRVVRHPLYLVEELAAIAGFIEAFSLAAALLLALQLAFQIRRILNEEAVLEASFPDYARYKARTARVIPGIW
ncbi:MAG TPA: isoprenylcysteine carboxylmethyltransferase family protein [Stellaceae bacterium]|nr:isoprenylcysteine carboxylmethyltransferase family protein [Stellaceae bacterium]